MTEGLRVVRAPFSSDQVLSLNAFQGHRGWHPFTCPNRGDGKHEMTTDLGVLVALKEGWVCLDCDYAQDWAHAWMADWSWSRSLR